LHILDVTDTSHRTMNELLTEQKAVYDGQSASLIGVSDSYAQSPSKLSSFKVRFIWCCSSRRSPRDPPHIGQQKYCASRAERRDNDEKVQQ